MPLQAILTYLIGTAAPASPAEQSDRVLSGVALLGIVIFWVVLAIVFLFVLNRVLRGAAPTSQRKRSAPTHDETDEDPWAVAAHRVRPDPTDDEEPTLDKL